MEFENVNGIFYRIYEDDDYAIVGNGSSISRNGLSDPKICPSNIEIQPTITHNGREYQVKKISSHAFRGCSLTKNISIPEGIEHIGGGAFYFCYCKTQKLVLPNSLESIESLVFAENYIDEFHIGENLKTFGAASFARNYFTKVIVDPKNIYLCHDEQYSLYNKNMTSLCAVSGYCYDFIVPSSVVQIFVQAFDGINIKSITIPSSVKLIESQNIVSSLPKLINIYLYCNIYNHSSLINYCWKLKNVFYYGNYNATNNFLKNVPDDLTVWVVDRQFPIISDRRTKLMKIKFPNEILLSCELPVAFLFSHFSILQFMVFIAM